MECPTSQDLSSFLAGHLAESRFECIAAHLEECERCGDILETLDSGRSLDEQVHPGQLEEQSWAESLGARQLTQRLLDRSSVSDDQLGPDSIGRIKIVRYLASGSFGRVFIGWDEELQRHVAVKLPRAGMFVDDQSREEIRREARQAARVEHPGIVPIYDIGTDDNDNIYIISGFVDGFDLKQWQVINQPSIKESLEMIVKIAEIIEFAHQHQLVHRDIKPGNILIDKEGKPHLVDFGLSINSDEQGASSTQGLVGTPAYLPPDYLDYVHPPVDPRGDLYSLGVVLFELLTNGRPYELEPETWQQTLKTTDPTRPRKLNRRISRKLERVCLKAIDRDPRKRFRSAAELSRQLQQVLNRTDKVETIPNQVSWQSWEKRTAITTVLILIVAVAWATSSQLRDGQQNQYSIPLFQTAPVKAQLANMAPVSVRITTNPPGAIAAIVPLAAHDWSPIPSAQIHPQEPTPLVLDLAPGDYLVEVMVPGYGFHQVVRRIASSEQTDKREFESPTIVIPENGKMSDGLVRVTGGEFLMGIPQKREKRTVRDFMIQAHEPTFADYQRVIGHLTPAMLEGLEGAEGNASLSQPLGYLTFYEALEFAEAAGLRMLSESEWMYVASNAGETKYPWGDDFPDVSTWEELPPLDITRSEQHDPIYGLYSGSTEWLATRSTDLDVEGDYFVVAGGVYSLEKGLLLEDIMNKKEKMLLKFGVNLSHRDEGRVTYPRLGVRLGRDLGPRYLTNVTLSSQ